MRIRLAVGAAVVSLTGSAYANDFAGWCFIDDCVGQAPITKDGFNTCEENCTMKNPVAVNGMDAILYDVSCRGDSKNYQQRMLFMKYADAEGKQRALALSLNGPEELQRCQ